MNRNNFIKNCLLAAVLFTSLCISSCAKAPLTVEYHTLSADASHSNKAVEVTSPLLIGPIRVNSFLVQGPIVKQRSLHSAYLLEQHHWAGNLNEILSQTLTQNLIFELGSEKIYSYPDASSNMGLRLAVSFSHFEEDNDGNAILQARWKLLSNADQSVLSSGSTIKTRSPDGSDYDALAKALSLCLADLSREIATGVRQIQSTLQSRQETQK